MGDIEQGNRPKPKAAGDIDIPEAKKPTTATDADGKIVAWNKVEKKKELSRAEKERIFVVKNISKRLADLGPESHYDIKKGICGVVSALCLIAGGVIVLKATATTPIFAADEFSMTLLIIGCSFGAPCLVCCVWVFIWPYLPFSWCRETRELREFVKEKRLERKAPTLFNSMVASANEHSKPPIIRTTLYAMFRKKEYTIVCHTMEEFQQIFEYKTGVPPPRQLLKLRDLDGSSEVFHFKPEEFILDLEPRGVKKGTMFWIYTKGGVELDILGSPEKRMDIVRNNGPRVDEYFRRSIARYHEEEEENEIDRQLNEMMASPPSTAAGSRPGSTGGPTFGSDANGGFDFDGDEVEILDLEAGGMAEEQKSSSKSPGFFSRITRSLKITSAEDDMDSDDEIFWEEIEVIREKRKRKEREEYERIHGTAEDQAAEARKKLLASLGKK